MYVFKIVGEEAYAKCQAFGYPPTRTYYPMLASRFKTIKEAKFRTIGFPHNGRIIKIKATDYPWNGKINP